MTGLDFMSIDNSSELEEKLNPILLKYLSQNYQNIPDSIELSGVMKALIMKYAWLKILFKK